MMIPRIAGAAALAAALLAAPASAEPKAQDQPEAAGSNVPTEQTESAGAAAAEPTESPEAVAVESPAAPEPTAPQGAVVRAAFTLAVVDREPTDAVRELGNDHDRVYFFTELHRFQGQELVHRWAFGGEVVAEVPFGVDGPRWRVYSSKALDPARLGTWTVSVVDAAGTVVEEQSFDYVAAPDPVADAAPAQPAPSAAQPRAAAAEPIDEAMQPGPAAPQP